MIKIERTDCPEVLEDSPRTSTHYNKKAVVKALWEMQHKKCCYCEQEIPKEGHLKAVEHFHPQSVYKEKRNDWKNLLLACAQCNGKKSDKFPTTKNKPLLIDPSDPSMDPEEHITFIVDERRVKEYGLPVERNNSKRGRATIDVVGLDGTFYLRKRRDWHSRLASLYINLLEAMDQENNHELNNCCQRFTLYMSAKKPFAAYAREFARQKRLGENFNIRIPIGAET